MGFRWDLRVFVAFIRLFRGLVALGSLGCLRFQAQQLRELQHQALTTDFLPVGFG